MKWKFKFQLVLSLIFLIINVAESQFLQLIITPTITEVQQLSTYDFVLNFYQINTIPAGSIIMVPFPTDYQSTTLQNYNCTPISWTGSVNLVCQIENRILKITGGFPSDINQRDLNLQFSVLNIKNPIASGATSSFSARLIASNSTTLVSTGAFGDTIIIFTSGALSMQTSVFPTTVNQISTLTVTVTTKHKIPKTGYLNLRLDTYWKTNIFNTTQVITDSSQCFPSTNVSNNIRCSLTSGTTQLLNLVIKYLFDDDFTGSFSFTIFPFLNPPTTAPQGSFQLTSYNSVLRNQKIDSISNQYLSGTTVNQITSPKIVLNSYIISSQTQAMIQCYINNIIGPNDKIFIQFPLQFDLSKLTLVLAQNYQATNLVISSGNLLSFRNMTLNSAGSVQFVIKNVILPGYKSSFSGFSIKTQRSSYGMDYVNNGFVVRTMNGDLSCLFQSLSNEVGVMTDYKLVIGLSHVVNNDDFLVIQFGSSQYSFNLSNLDIMRCVSSRRSGCIISIVSQNKLKFSNIFTDQTKNLTLLIKNIQNPYNIGLTTSLILTSYRTIKSIQYQIDQSSQSDISINLIGRKLLIRNIQISSTSDYTYQQCDLSIKIVNNNPVDINSYVDIIVPIQLLLPQRVVCNFGCVLIANTTSTVRVYLTQKYDISQLPVIILFNVRNPQSTRPTSTFVVTIYNSLGQILQYTNPIQGGIQYKVNKPSQFTLSIHRNSTKNSQSIVSYSFNIVTLFDISNGIIILQVPSYISCNNNCPITYLNSTYYQLVSTSVSTLNKMVLLNYDMNNHYSFQPLVINIKYLTNDQLFTYGKGSTTIANNIPSILDVSISWTNQQLLSKGSLIITNLSLTQFNNINDSQIIMLISFASDFDLSNSSSLLTHTKTTNNFNIQIPINSTLTNIQILNLTYPSTSPSLPIHITLKTSITSFIISKSNAIYWSISCNLPCKTCSSTNISSCLSCYSNSSLVDGHILFQPSTNQCVRICDNRYYPNLTYNQCYPCSPSCYNCQTYDTCTSCNTGSYLLKQNYTCYLNQCPNGYFIYYSQCKLCTYSLHCKTCTDSLTCTSCIDTFYYYQQKCLTQCPINITVQNTFTNNCDSCPINCTTCQKLIDGTIKCLQCQNGFFYDSGGCYQTCRTPGLVPDGQICVTCHSTCLSCRFNKYYCLTCNTSTNYKYFYNNSCLINCPSGYYNSQTEPYLCLPCTQPCQSCTNSSVQSCLSCIQGYSLNDRICQSTCSATFYSFNGSCLSCVPPCKTCSSQFSCMTCLSNYSLFVDECVTSCNEGYVSINGQCLRCSDNCRTCSSVNYCTGCFNDSFLHVGKCLDVCPVKFYKKVSEWRCDSCLYNCLNCLNQNYCTSCQAGYQLSLLNNSCINTCAVGYIPVLGVCTQCNSNCSQCVESVQKCISCRIGYYFAVSEYKCYEHCLQPLRQYEENMSCVVLCLQPSYQERVSTLIGLVSQDIIYCRSCPYLCKQCISSSHCTECVNNTYKYNNSCVSQCPSQSPYVYNNLLCRRCNVVNCFECLQDKCKQCQSGYLLIGDSMCISNCSSNQYYNLTTKQCILVNNNTNNNNTNNNNTNNNSTVDNNTNNNNSTINNTNTVSQTINQSVKLNFVPFPFLIVGFLLGFIIFILYLSQSILVIPLVTTIIGLIVMLCAFLTLILLFLTNSIFNNEHKQFLIAFIILTISIALIIVFNFFTTTVYLSKAQHPYHKYGKFLSIIIILLSTLINFSTYQILNSKIYHFISISKPSNNSFWNLHNKLTKISGISYLCFIITSIILIFTLNTSQYLYYSSIELTILSIIKIVVIILQNSWPIDYSISQTHSYQVNDSFNKLQDLSINQKDINSQIQSITTIHAQSQIPYQNNTLINKNQSNLKKTKSQFFPINKKSQLTDFLPSFAIKQGIQDGLFRQNFQQTKKKQQQQIAIDLLDSASKMNSKNSQQRNKVKSSLSNQVNIFDIGDQFQQYQHGSQKQILEKENKLKSDFEDKIQKGSSSNKKSIIDKPQSPSKSKRRSRQQSNKPQSQISIKSHTKKQSSILNQSQFKQLPIDSAQDLDNMITAQIQKQKFQPSEKAESQLPEIVLIHKKQDPIIVESQDQKNIVIEKQPEKQQIPLYINQNPNIIFQVIDQEADQYDTKFSPQQTHLGTEQDQIQSIDIFKNDTNRYQKQLIPNIHKINPPKIYNKKPQINHIRDTQVEILSSHQSTQQNQNSIQNQNHQQTNFQIQSNNNIFLPNHDQQDELNRIQPPQNNFLKKPKTQLKKQIQHADFQSIYTISDKDHVELQNNQQKAQQTFYKTQTKFKKPQMIEKNNPKNIPNLNDSLIEDIQDFQQDNQKPSNLFSRPVIKNVLSNQYSQMPVGIQFQKRDKKINFSPKKNKRK